MSIFNEIEDLMDLMDLGIAADNEYSEHQLIKFGPQTIKNTGEFETDFRIWHGLVKTIRTWNDFTTNFEAAYTFLITTRGKNM